MNYKVKTYVTSRSIQKMLPSNSLLYTIEYYGDNRMWEDDTFSIAYKNGLKSHEYVEAMKLKFDCIDYNGKLFFKTKEHCEEAIKFIDSIVIISKLNGNSDGGKSRFNIKLLN